jgi:glycine cleavage system H protein
VVESVKAASDVYSPVEGEVTSGNPRLASEPEAVNTDPYGGGWLMRVRPAHGATGALLSPAEYEKLLEAEGG